MTDRTMEALKDNPAWEGALLQLLHDLHKHLPEADRPMACSDLSDDQRDRLLDAGLNFTASVLGWVKNSNWLTPSPPAQEGQSKLVYDKERRTIILETDRGRYTLTKISGEPPQEGGIAEVGELANSLREACGVLDEPFHHDAIREKLERAAAELSRLTALVGPLLALPESITEYLSEMDDPEARALADAIRRARAALQE